MADPIIKIQNLSFSYNGHEVLHGVKFNVKAGEYVSIIGPNGAGKSTLLKCLNRIVQTPHGAIEIMGRPLDAYSQKELGKLVGYVPQIREYSFSYTVYDFVMMGRYPYLKALEPEAKEDRQIVGEILELTGLRSLQDRRVNTLSGGERQKVYLAASLAQQPRVLLLDEPTTHLDPKHQVEIQQIVCDLSRRYKMTVIHVTHDLSHVMSWSHKIAALKNGQIIYEGDPEIILTPEKMETIFETKFFFLKHPKTGHMIVIPEDKVHEKR